MNYINRIILFSACFSFSSFSYSVDIESKPETTQVKTIREDLKKPAVMQDLAYGNILFEYYRGKPLIALNAILVAEKKGLLPNHQQSARLLSGVIYLDLGMLSHAQTIFTELLSEEALKNELLSRLEFYLGKLHYRQGDYQQAKLRLEKVVDLLNVSLKDESLIMLSNIDLSRNEKESARDRLLKVSRHSKLAAFSRYNLGMSWLREGDLINAKPFLIQSTDDQYTQESEESSNDKIVVNSLQDRALVALGYHYLSNKAHEDARAQFLKVRLGSLQTNKALLGIGWSYLESHHYKKALSHWLELSTKDARDIAVQEVLLAIPYAYQKLDSQKEALNAYLFASNSYDQQIQLIDKLLIQIEQGQLLENTVASMLMAQKGDLSSVYLKDDGIKDSKLFGEEFDYYLFELISEHQFNEGFRSYQKLGVLSDVLNYWEEQLPVFNEILKANKIRFNNKIPLIDAYLTDGSFDSFEAQLLALETNIASLKKNENMHLLANDAELSIHNRITSLNDKLSKVPASMISVEQKLNAKRAQGVLQWQLESFKVGKIWALEKQSKIIKDILFEMNSRKMSLASARKNARVRFIGFQDKVDYGTSRLVGLRNNVKQQINLQVDVLKSQIIEELNVRKKSLEHFLLQSDLAVARMHGQAILIPEQE